MSLSAFFNIFLEIPGLISANAGWEILHFARFYRKKIQIKIFFLVGGRHQQNLAQIY